MRILTVVIAAAALLLLLSMLLCGLWSRSKGLPDQKAKKFHAQLGIAAILFSIAAIILLMIRF